MSLQGHIDFIVRGNVGEFPISPKTIELGLFKSFAEDIEAIINSIPEVQKNSVVISIEEGSFKATAIVAAMAANTLAVDAVSLNNTNDLSSINTVRSKVIERWDKKTKANPSIEFEIRPNGLDGIKVNYQRIFKKDENVWLQSELYLYGLFTDIGGKSKSNIHLTTDKNDEVVISCKVDEIKNIKENKVYHSGGVRVLAKQNLYTGEIKDASFIEFIDYNPSYNENELLATIEKGREAWKQIPDHIEWVRNLRNDE